MECVILLGCRGQRVVSKFFFLSDLVDYVQITCRDQSLWDAVSSRFWGILISLSLLYVKPDFMQYKKNDKDKKFANHARLKKVVAEPQTKY